MAALFLVCPKTARADTTLVPNSYNDKQVRQYNVAVDAQSSEVITLDLAQSGRLQLTCSIDQVYDGNVSFALYKDRYCMDPVSDTYIYFDQASTNLKDRFTYQIEKKGQYYLLVTNNSLTKCSTHLIGRFNSDTAVNLKNGVTYIKSTNAKNGNVYHRVVVGSTGYIAVNVYGMDNNSAKYYISLCNSDKKDISNIVIADSTSSKGRAIFAVEKGTYYLRVRPNTSSLSNYYAIRSKFTSINDKSKSNKKKAPTIKLNKITSGIVLHTDTVKSCDYYKFKLTKSMKVKIDSTSYGTEKLYIRLSSAKGTIGGNPLKNYVKLKKGTYYVCVQKSSNRVGGYYKFKIRTK